MDWGVGKLILAEKWVLQLKMFEVYQAQNQKGS